MSQQELIARPLAPDVYTLLRLFENERGIDVGMNWLDLLQVYHSVYDKPDAPKSSWQPARLRRAVNAAASAGMIACGTGHWGKDWMLSRAGLEARKAEYERRKRG